MATRLAAAAASAAARLRAIRASRLAWRRSTVKGGAGCGTGMGSVTIGGGSVTGGSTEAAVPSGSEPSGASTATSDGGSGSAAASQAAPRLGRRRQRPTARPAAAVERRAVA